jgi:hypothetical protein
VNECAFPKVTALIVGMSMLALAIFGLSPSTIVESTFAQGVDTTLLAELGTGEKDFLRGYQVTDDNGTVRFTTVYPGWYEGRAIHIHVKVRLLEELENPFEWTSQFYLNNSINELIHTQPPYSDHGPVNMLNEEDGIFTGPSTDGLVQANAGKHLMLNLTKDQQGGYIGNFNIGVNATQ